MHERGGREEKKGEEHGRGKARRMEGEGEETLRRNGGERNRTDEMTGK